MGRDRLNMQGIDLSDALIAAKALLGRKLVHVTDEGTTAGYIVETEAYTMEDAASHAYGGERLRNRSLFMEAGTVYVYFTYGMHYCVNIVTGAAGHGQGVLLRALEPTDGIELMIKRRGFAAQGSHLNAVQGSNEERVSRTTSTVNEQRRQSDAAMHQEPGNAASLAGRQGQALRALCNGPAKLVQAMGITKSDNGSNIFSGKLRLENGFVPESIAQTTRVGITKATDLPWRFYVAGNSYVSKR